MSTDNSSELSKSNKGQKRITKVQPNNLTTDGSTEDLSLSQDESTYYSTPSTFSSGSTDDDPGCDDGGGFDDPFDPGSDAYDPGCDE